MSVRLFLLSFSGMNQNTSLLTNWYLLLHFNTTVGLINVWTQKLDPASETNNLSPIFSRQIEFNMKVQPYGRDDLQYFLVQQFSFANYEWMCYWT